MRLRILLLAYPLIPVGPEACGGTEQVLFRLLEGLNRPPWNHHVETFTLAHEQSCVAGGFASWGQVCQRFGVPLPPGAERPGATLTPADLEALEQATSQAALAWLRHHPVDLVHNQGAAFYRAAHAVPDLQVLFTLHLPRSLYPPQLWQQLPPNVILQCVSRLQHRQYRQSPQGRELALTGWIRNGVPLDRFSPAPPGRRGQYLLYAGRMAPEKGPHLAIELARRARRPLLLLGQVYPFPSHQDYFQREIEPRLGDGVIWKPAPSFAEKQAWLASAAAVVIPSEVEETSSLIAMEAAASGTPVIALNRGALPETVIHGRTGFLCESIEQMTRAAAQVDRLRARDCRAWAESCFDCRRMVSEYAELYCRLARARVARRIPPAAAANLTQNGGDG